MCEKAEYNFRDVLRNFPKLCTTARARKEIELAGTGAENWAGRAIAIRGSWPAGEKEAVRDQTGQCTGVRMPARDSGGLSGGGLLVIHGAGPSGRHHQKASCTT